MGNYGAERHPDLPRAQIIARNYALLSDQRVLTDQWDIDATTRVSSYCDGTNRINVKVKYDPTLIDLV